jgi:stage II sporulation protein AA (anti-sigma F factor antagonist)
MPANPSNMQCRGTGKGGNFVSLQLETDYQSGVLVVRLAGELDHHTAELVKSRVEAELDKGRTNRLVFNFSQLTFMDSSGLGVILGRYRRISQMGGKMMLCGVNPPLQRLLELSGIMKILAVAHSEADALAQLGEV